MVSRVESCNERARSRGTEFDGPNQIIKCFEVVFGHSIGAFHEANAEVTQSNMIILQSSRFELTNDLIIRGWC